MTVRFPGRHKRVLIDTNVWIYHLQQHAEHGAAAGRILESLEHGRIRGVSSELLLLELIVRPLQLQRQDIADEYEAMVREFPNLELVPISRDVLLDAATLRARHRLRTPDAIQLATAIRAGATLAVTNDAAWRAVSEIDVLLLTEMTR